MKRAFVALVLAGCGGGSPGAPDAGADAPVPDAEPDPVAHVTAQIIDFEDRIPLDGSFADRLVVSVAEPIYNSVSDRWLLQTTDLIEMDVATTSPVLTYETYPPTAFDETACIQVISDELGAVPAVRCYAATPELDVDATLLDAATLDAIEQALGGTELTSVVIGVVLDEGLPAAGALVTPSSGTVQYLNDDLSSTTGLTETSASGVFVSIDAPYPDNLWTATRDELVSAEAIGGLIQNKVTIVILELS